jgi:hypothetical protein
MNARSREEWVRLVRYATTGMTELQIGQIAECSFQAEARGDPRRGVWHSSAQVLGYPERCHCAPCEKERAEHIPGA